MDQQIPRFFLDEDADVAVQQKPAQRLEILAALGRFDGQRNVAAALGGAMIAQNLARLEVLASERERLLIGDC